MPVRPRPNPWRVQKQDFRHKPLLPFHLVNWLGEWLAHMLSNWVFLEILESLGKFSVLIAVIFYFAGAGDRLKQKHYQAWQVVNTAQGKGGSGGRIDALEQLNADHVHLVGVDASGAFLQGIRLPRADLVRANLWRADIRGGHLAAADLSYSDLDFTNLRSSDLSKVNLEGASLADADLFEANLSGANLDGARFDRADLRYADLRNTAWSKLESIALANLHGVKNAPAGFVDWAKAHGAVSIQADSDWYAMLPQK